MNNGHIQYGRHLPPLSPTICTVNNVGPPAQRCNLKYHPRNKEWHMPQVLGRKFCVCHSLHELEDEKCCSASCLPSLCRAWLTWSKFVGAFCHGKFYCSLRATIVKTLLCGESAAHQTHTKGFNLSEFLNPFASVFPSCSRLPRNYYQNISAADLFGKCPGAPTRNSNKSPEHDATEICLGESPQNPVRASKIIFHIGEYFEGGGITSETLLFVCSALFAATP